VFQIFSDLILHKRVKFEEGNVKFFEKNVVIFPAEYMVLLQKGLEEKGLENLIYQKAKANGISWFRNLNNYYKISPEDIFKWGVNTLALAGWGKTEVLNVDREKKEVSLLVKHSVIAEEYGKSDHPVDHFIRGSFAGGATILFGEECDTIELKCLAMGDSECEFKVKASVNIDKTNEIVKKQLGL